MRNLIIVLCFGLLGCANEPIYKSKTNNNEMQVELLFEHDGCRVYRFYDGSYKYYTDCRGSVQWTEQHGKSSSEEGNQTVD